MYVALLATRLPVIACTMRLVTISVAAVSRWPIWVAALGVLVFGLLFIAGYQAKGTNQRAAERDKCSVSCPSSCPPLRQ